MSQPSPAGPSAGFKSRSGLARLLPALRYSLAGVRAAWRHEAAFRQEVVVGVPLVAFALWHARTPRDALLLVGAVVMVWIVELLNSAIETLADATVPHAHPLVGRAKDLGSAAVMASLLLAVATWGVVLLG